MYQPEDFAEKQKCIAAITRKCDVHKWLAGWQGDTGENVFFPLSYLGSHYDRLFQSGAREGTHGRTHARAHTRTERGKEFGGSS